MLKVALDKDPIKLEFCDSDLLPDQLGFERGSESFAPAFIRIAQSASPSVRCVPWNTSKVESFAVGETKVLQVGEKAAFQVG